MVWTIRSKTAFTFEKGTHSYITGKFRVLALQNTHELPYIGVKSDRYSPVRVTHNYRNMSRACKQFLLGDPYAEQLMILLLRLEFLWPINEINSPIENYKPINRLLADHTDRHYSLISNNQHPVQLFLYESLNKKYRKEQEMKNYVNNKGELTYNIAYKLRLEYILSFNNKLAS